MYKGSLDAPGYSYRYIGGNAQKVIIPCEVMLKDCLLPYEGDAFFKASHQLGISHLGRYGYPRGPAHGRLHL